jgi:hypothetical protein
MYNGSFGSTILSNKQKGSLLSLVELESNKLELLWRGSRDGFRVGKFHSLCDGKPNTLLIVKSTQGYIFGRYTAVPWSSGKIWKADNTAFLYSLTNPTNLPSKMPIKTPGTNAVCHSPLNGPCFGTGIDLGICDSSNTNNGSNVTPKSYDIPLAIHDPSIGRFLHGGSIRKFLTVEVEVFQVV